jgi:hypothetical protein
MAIGRYSRHPYKITVLSIDQTTLDAYFSHLIDVTMHRSCGSKLGEGRYNNYLNNCPLRSDESNDTTTVLSE